MTNTLSPSIVSRQFFHNFKTKKGMLATAASLNGTVKSISI